MRLIDADALMETVEDDHPQVTENPFGGEDE